MSSSSEPHVVEDCRGVVQVLSDGTVRRSAGAPPFAVEIPEDECGVEWKDVAWTRDHGGLNARLYRPRHLGAANDARLPVLAYFHGGGFCFGSGRWPCFHAVCLRLAAELPALVASFDYRLAPEHRLPAAQDDGAAAVRWLLRRSPASDPWLADAADLSRAFVAGDSAGGNVAHHVAAGLGRGGGAVRGAVLLAPAMFGEARTRSERECPPDAFLTVETCERYMRLALPEEEGWTWDHPVINPAGPLAPALDAVAMAPVLVVAGGSDLLRDRNREYARRMKEEWGKDVEYVEIAGAGHGFFQLDPWSEHADEVVRIVRRFVVDHMDSSE